jgi:hypothetical protein
MVVGIRWQVCREPDSRVWGQGFGSLSMAWRVAINARRFADLTTVLQVVRRRPSGRGWAAPVGVVRFPASGGSEALVSADDALYLGILVRVDGSAEWPEEVFS